MKPLPLAATVHCTPVSETAQRYGAIVTSWPEAMVGTRSPRSPEKHDGSSRLCVHDVTLPLGKTIASCTSGSVPGGTPMQIICDIGPKPQPILPPATLA